MLPVVAVRLGTLGPERYVRSMPTRRPYPSDLSDARWVLIEPVLSAWRFELGVTTTATADVYPCPGVAYRLLGSRGRTPC